MKAKLTECGKKAICPLCGKMHEVSENETSIWCTHKENEIEDTFMSDGRENDECDDRDTFFLIEGRQEALICVHCGEPYWEEKEGDFQDYANQYHMHQGCRCFNCHMKREQ